MQNEPQSPKFFRTESQMSVQVAQIEVVNESPPPVLKMSTQQQTLTPYRAHSSNMMMMQNDLSSIQIISPDRKEQILE